MTISILKSTRVIYNVLSGKFNIVQIVSLNSPLLAWEWLHSKVALFFHSLLSSSPSSHGNRVQLFLHGCKVNEAVASPCSASYYRSLTQYSYFLMKKKCYIALSHLLGYLKGMCGVLFILKSANWEASSCFQGPPAGKVSNLVIIRIKILYTVWKKTHHHPSE